MCFLGERLKTSPYSCDIANLLRRVVDCDESAPVRSTAIEYLQTLEQKRSFSSISTLFRPKSPTSELRLSQDSPGYESDEFSSSSPKLSPPAKKKGRLASLISKVEHDNMVRRENDEKEISKMNRALEQKAKLAEASRPRKDSGLNSWFRRPSDGVTGGEEEEEGRMKRSDSIARKIIDLTEDSKYVDDGEDGASSQPLPQKSMPPSKALLSSLQMSRTSPKTSQVLSTSILSRDILSGYSTPNRQKSSSLPFYTGEKTIHTKRANEHPILRNGNGSSSSIGGVLRGGAYGGSASNIPRDPTFGLPLKTPPKVDFMDTLPLSKDQEAVLKLAATQQSFFFTGAAGTGKSFVLRRVVQAMKSLYGNENVFVTASTGIAACNIGGITLHSFAGIGLGNKPVSELARRVTLSSNHRARWRRARCLIIDEISMIR